MASILVVTLAGSLLAVPPAQAEPVKPQHLTAQVEPLDRDGGEVAGKGWPTRPRPEVTLPAPVWPAAGTQLRALARRAKAAAGGSATVASEVSAKVIDRDVVPPQWRAGVVARVSASKPGSNSVALDYSKFRYAYGANWSSRLRWWRLPECALITPDAAGCSATPLPSRNDPATTTVTADVTVESSGASRKSSPSTLIALAAAAAGDSGDFSATPLSASSTWSAGDSTGGFSWSYPVRVPPAMGGPLPDVSLSYSSSSVDGRSSASNNQPSWIGEGFEYSPGFIERRYVACSDDTSGSPNNPVQTADLCWRSDNATMSLGGSSSELVYESGKGWHGRSEDGAKIEKLTGASNGDGDGEYWKVTATDGTQYFFGLNKLTGQDTDTNSAWTVPVYGNHSGEPGNASTFSDSRETQAWRWNLDYAIDTHGNTISLWYDKETNQYGAEATSSKNVSYVRGGTLNHIDYGTWDRGSSDRSITPLAQVIFETADRCLADCSNHDGSHWPDTPWDQECKAAATSCDNYSPTFWSTRRLSKIRTRVWDTTKTSPGWQDVDSYTLSHSFPSPGDGQKGGLWLDSIVRTGHVGGTVTMPAVSFEPVALTNRVLTKTNTTNNWQRLSLIHTESGGLIQVTYSLPECSSSNLPASPQNNTKLCYPVIGPDPYSTSGGDITEWWHKYVVRHVSQTDVQLADGHQAPTVNTYYIYQGAPAWHYADDDGLTKVKYKTWNQFRGYATVLTRVGDSNQTLSKTTYLRGMHGDREAPSGGTRSVTVPASLGSETVYDEDEYAGMVREEVLYNGTEDKPVSKTVNVPWRSAPTASRTINGDTATARFTGTKATYKGTALGVDGAGGWRVTSQSSTFDDYGQPTSVQDNGDASKSDDETCVTTSYNRNTANGIGTLPRQVTVTALPCGTGPTSTDDVISDTLSFYDGATSASTAPTRGEVTRVDTLKSWTASAGTSWLTTTTATFDAFGRQLTGTDAVRGNTTTTAYSPAKSLMTKRTDTTQQGWVTTQEMYPYWGVPGKVTDPNGRVAEGTYDALGRTAEVWAVGWTRADHGSQPSTRFSYYYSPDRSSYSYVKTEALNAGGGTDVSYQIFDGLLRPRQTQNAAVGGGRVVTDTLYDGYGRAEMTFAAHAEPGNPSGSLWWEPEWSVPSQTLNVYDRAGRVTDSIFRSGDGVTNIVEKWRTKTTYEGDRTTVVPPSGGTTTTTVNDALGRTTELRQYTTAAGAAGAYDTTKYGYNGKGQLETVTDPVGDQWSYKYDIRGRQVEANDPDKGRSLSDYNDAGDLIKSTDARGEVLVYTYDALGRKSITYDDAVADANKRVEFKYDKMYTGVSIRGMLTEAIRYDNGNAYKWQARGFNERYQIAGEHYVIPAAEAGLAGTYIYGHGYSAYTGAPTTLSYPAGGGLVTETVTTRYDEASGLPRSLETTLPDVNSYVVGQQYSAYGEPTVTTLKIGGGVYAEQSIAYETDTRRVREVSVKPETATGTISDRKYSYDNAGNVRSIADTPQVGSADIQCFGYDQLRRLTSAWTPKAEVPCETAPSTDNLGGPAPYWLDWTIDKIGNRTKEVSHAAGGDTLRSYTVPVAGLNVVRPHAVTSMTTTLPGASAGSTVSYGYDNTGNMTTRPGPTSGQVLTWDAEGRVSKIVEGATTTTNLYDASGSRLIRRDGGGSTLYLPGMEIRRTVSGSTASLSGTRYYSFAGALIASCGTASQSLTWLFNDHQGTQQVAVNAYTQKATIRRQTPYGGERGSPSGSWPNNKGFVGGDIDPTGLVHIGAREYDAVLGRFISVDPVQDLADPQQWNAYSYSNNTPITQSDPTGTDPCPGGGGGCGYDDTPGHVQNPGACGSANSCEQHQNLDGYGTSGISGSSGGSGGGGSGRGGSGGNNGSSPGCGSANACDAGHALQTERLREAMIQILSHPEGSKGSQIGLACMMYPSECVGWLNDLKNGAVPWHVAASIHCLHAMGCLDEYGINTMMGGPSLGSTVNHDVADALFLSIVGGGPSTVVQLIRTALRGAETNPGSFVRSCAAEMAHNSFDPSTPVLMADGTTKPIRDVQVGDKVVATDPETGKTTVQEVTELYNNLDHDLVDIKVWLSNGDVETIHTTVHHPFWDKTAKAWVDAFEIKPGHQLLSFMAGTVTVIELAAPEGADYMINLTVSNTHTYYVLAGNTPVLVHNCGGAAASWASKADFSDMKTMSKKFDAHAADFGITGNRNKANLGAYETAMRDHMTAPGTKIYRFDYRGQGQAVGFIDPSTNKMVMLHADSGKFWSGWRLGNNQFSSIVDRGFLK